jgi:hypothetical protein
VSDAGCSARSWALFTGQLESECRRLCSPKRWPGSIRTPALMAAGLKWSATNTAGETGTQPPAFRDGNRKFVALA